MVKQKFQTPEEEIAHLERLLALEQAEELREFQAKVLETPLKERQKQGNTWYPVRIKNTQVGTGGKYIIEIERQVEYNQPHPFQVGGSAALFWNAPAGQKSPQMAGVISYVDQGQLHLQTMEDELPDWLDERLLGVDQLFDENSFREMKSALNQLRKAELKSDLARLRDRLWGFREAKTPTALTPVPVGQSTGLNDSQKEAIGQMLAADDFFIIHGPPGTGKTTTLVAAIEAALPVAPQMLVCAPSNTAADHLTEKLHQKGLKVLRVGNPARISEDIIPHTFDYQIAQHPDAKEIKRLRKLAYELKRMAYKFKKYFDKSEREQKQAMIRESKAILAQIGQMEKYILEQARDHTQVFVSTLVGSANNLLRGKIFDLVLIDEAGQALEPATWIPITRARKVVLAGDHCQLPPTVKSKTADKEGFAVTLMEKVMQRTGGAFAALLDTQYRMHEDIMAFSNGQFYENRLKADASVKERRLWRPTEAANEPLLFVDTAGTGFEEKFHPETVGLSNPEEGKLVLKHLNQWLLDNDHHLKNRGRPLRVLLISPYREQVEFLKKEVASFPAVSRLHHLKIGSVDGFQGQEADVVYISLVRSNDKKEIGFLRDIRRMNVAMTRAKMRLVVVGDSGTLSGSGFYAGFLDFAAGKNAYQSAWEFMG